MRKLIRRAAAGRLTHTHLTDGQILIAAGSSIAYGVLLIVFHSNAVAYVGAVCTFIAHAVGR